MKNRAPNKTKKITAATILKSLFFLLLFTNQTIAQEGRFQKFGVELDPWAEEQIHFWTQVYTEYASSDALIHDSVNLGHVYRTIKHPDQTRDQIMSIRDGLLRLAKLQPPSLSQKKVAEDLKPLFHAMKEIDDPKAYGFAASLDRIRVQAGLKDQLESAFLISKRYLPRMREIFREEAVPEELVYLSFVESAFNPEARSKVGASGIWQFMPETAIKELRVTPSIDERHDPLKSTRAAAKHLKKNHDILKSWALAIMAYHHGSGLVQRAVRKVGSRDPIAIIRTFKDPSFRFASRNYLFEFLAMCDVTSNLKPLFRPDPGIGLPNFITVSFQTKIKLKELLQRYRLNEEEIRILNPHFREPIWRSENPIPAHYPVRLAGITLEEFRRLEYPHP